MSDTEKEFKLTRFNRYLNLHSWVEWLDFIDKMREEHYQFFMPLKEEMTSSMIEKYKYQKLKDLLNPHKGWLIADHNNILNNIFKLDSELLNFWIWNQGKYYSQATPFIPDYSEKEKEKRYIGVHGADKLPIIGFNLSSSLEYVYKALYRSSSSGTLFHEFCDFFALYNGKSSPAYVSTNTKGKVYDNHNGVTPTGDYREFYNKHDTIFGNWQDLTRDSDGTWRAARTYNVQIEVIAKPEFSLKYRVILAGKTYDSFEFDGLGIADFANKYNVFFDSGPVQGEYHSPFIGIDQFYICKNPEAAENTNKGLSTGWKVRYVTVFILPAEGHWAYDYVPEEEREQWASYMVKRLRKKFAVYYPAITQEENQ